MELGEGTNTDGGTDTEVTQSLWASVAVLECAWREAEGSRTVHLFAYSTYPLTCGQLTKNVKWKILETNQLVSLCFKFHCLKY